MVQIIAGRKGKGKTKHLLDMANSGIKAATGSIVYLDKSLSLIHILQNGRGISGESVPLMDLDPHKGILVRISGFLKRA